MIDIVLCASGADEVRITHDVARTGGGRARVVRRCADLAETAAAAAAGIGDVVLVDLDVKGLDRDAVADLVRVGTAVVGLRRADGAGRHTEAGLRHVVDAAAEVDELLAACERACTPAEPAQDAWVQDVPAPDHGEGQGTVLAVWGPHGAPGRSTVAVHLAAELALAGTDTVLVDADTHAPSVTQMLGVLDEAPGLVAACRAASRDTLDAQTLTSLLPALPTGDGHLSLLSGIGVPARWPEVRESSFEMVLEQLGRRRAVTVLDVAAPLEQDEDLTYDTLAPQRNAATLTALSRADMVLAVVAADPLSLTRLVREHERLSDLGVGRVHVVINRQAPPVPASRVRALVQERIPCASVHVLPEDKACRSVVWDGALLAERAPRSPLRKALRELGDDVRDEIGAPAVTG
jgi:MinD-like ATPase involved in chromosome partitioning or flagellar assembly